jgi:DNA-binding Lrp family transcriptional regulator
MGVRRRKSVLGASALNPPGNTPQAAVARALNISPQALSEMLRRK